MKLFALDLGNKQTKIMSEKKTKVLPSRFVEASQYGNRSLLEFAKKEKDVKDFTSKRDEDFTYVWGTELDEDVIDMMTDTIGFGAQRYASREFKLLTDFALSELALDYPEAEESILEVAIVTGVPTSDYNNEKALEALQKAIKDDHNVTVDGKSLNIRVKKLYVLPQPIGTVIDVVTDEKGNIKEDSPLINGYIGVVDVGGGTVLIDALKKMNMVEENRKQMQIGAYTLYESIVKDLTAQGYNVTEYEIEKVVREGNVKEKYIWSPDGVQQIDITEIVMKNRRIFTRNVATAVKSTYKEFDRMQKILITGGAANLLIKKEIEEEIKKAEFVKDSEIANVRGFQKYALMKLNEERK